MNDEQKRISQLEEVLENVLAYHKWVLEKHVWHMEANAQIGCLRMINEVKEVLGKEMKP